MRRLRRRYRVQDIDYPEKGRNFWRRRRAEKGLQARALNSSQRNLVYAQAGVTSEIVRWEMIDRETQEVLAAYRVNAPAPAGLTDALAHLLQA